MVAMITTSKLDDLRPAGIAPRQTDCSHCCFCTRRRESYFFDRGHGLNNYLGQFYFSCGWRAEACSAFEHVFQRSHNLWVSMSGNKRSPRAHIIDVFFPIYVNNVATSAPLDKQGTPANCAPGAHGTVHA